MANLTVEVIIGTTPTIDMTLDDETIDLSAASHVYATFVAANTPGGYERKLRKKDGQLTLSGNSASYQMTQEETLAFGVGNVQCQLNWTYNSGATREASNIVTFYLSKNLEMEVLA